MEEGYQSCGLVLRNRGPVAQVQSDLRSQVQPLALVSSAAVWIFSLWSPLGKPRSSISYKMGTAMVAHLVRCGNEWHPSSIVTMCLLCVMCSPSPVRLSDSVRGGIYVDS